MEVLRRTMDEGKNWRESTVERCGAEDIGLGIVVGLVVEKGGAKDWDRDLTEVGEIEMEPS